MHPQSAMEAGAGEAQEGAVFGGGPLRGRGGAVAAGTVWGKGLQGGELDRRNRSVGGWGERKGQGKIEGDGRTLLLVSGSTSHIFVMVVLGCGCGCGVC